MISRLMYKALHRAAFVAAFLLFSFSIAAADQSPLDQARQAVADSDYTRAAKLYDEALVQAPKDRSVLVEAGDVNMELERFMVAQSLYQRALDLDRKSADISRRLSRALSALGQHQQAIEAARKAMSYDDGSLESHLALTDAYIAAGRDSLSRAELTALAAKEKFASAAEPYLALGDLYFARGVYELAVLQYEEALKRNESLIEPRVRLGRAYREQARRTTDDQERNELYNKALMEFNKVTGLNPKLARAWYEQGEIFLLAERYQEAGQSFEAYVHLRPEDPRGDIQLARAAFGGHFYAQTVEPLERVMSRTDSLSIEFQPAARAMLAKSYYAVKDYAKSAKFYSMLPDSAFDLEAHRFFASALLLSGDTTNAIKAYHQIVAEHPEDCDMSQSFGDLLYKMKRFDEVVDVFTKRLASCPNEPASTPYLYIGLAHFAQKRYEDAIRSLQQSIASDSAVFTPYYWLMNAYAASKQFDKAADIARVMSQRSFTVSGESKTAAQAFPREMASAWFFIGLRAFQLKDWKPAIAAMEKAIQLQPDYADAYLYTAFAYHSMASTSPAEKENACKYYKLALKYNPKSAEAAKNLKALGCE